MAKVEDLKQNGKKQTIFVENSGVRLSGQENKLQDLSTPKEAIDTTEEKYVSRYDMGKVEEEAKIDNNGRIKDAEAEAVSLIDVHMERKKKEMDDYFRKQDEERELAEALGETGEEESVVEDSDELSESLDEEYDPVDEVDDFEEEMQKDFDNDMDEKIKSAENIADDLLSNLDNDEDDVETTEEKPLDNSEIKKAIVEDVMTPHPEEEVELPDAISSDIDEDDFSELDEDTDEMIDDDPLDSPEMKELQKSITEKIHTVSNKLNLSSFSIAKKPVTITAALNAGTADIKCADWALMSSERCIRMSEFSGSEMEKLITAATTRRLTLSNVRNLYNLLYKHDINPSKPKTLEAWLKATSFLDSDHLFMAAYASTFGDSNHIPYTCVDDKCGAMWITDNRPIMDMVKFKDAEAKKKFHNIINSTPNYNSNFYKTEIVQISDKYAIGIKVPSIYDAVYEMAALDDVFRNKYSDFITILQYCDAFYLIDAKTKQLAPIEYKKYPNNMNKNTKSKIFTYSKILSKLSTDQYTSILAYMREINTTGDELEYIIPESTCEKCGKTIPESPQSARDLLFTRHQLTALRTI